MRPDCCQAEGCDSRKFLEGHHWSHARERWLDVLWLCAACHRRAHSRGFVQPKPGIARHKGGIPDQSEQGAVS
jgi:hypothetical protein